MGELGLFYRACNVVFIGKTLTVEGGQNPLEPANLDCALIAGPSMTNFRPLTERLDQARAILRVRDATTLAAAVARLLGDDSERKRMADGAKGVAVDEAHALDAVIEELAPYMDGLSAKGAS